MMQNNKASRGNMKKTIFIVVVIIAIVGAIIGIILGTK